METLKNIWNAFQGNKTVLGLALLQLAPYLPEPYQTYVTLVGTALAGVGVANKVTKIATATTKGTNGEE